MKKLFTTLFFAAMFTAVMAVPAKRGQWKTVTLADGTKVRVELRGDEFCHFWQAEDGRTFIKDAQKGYYKAADVTLMMNKAKARLAKVKAATEARRAQSRTGSRQTGGDRPYFGDHKGLVILVEFDDVQFTHGTPELYQQIRYGGNQCRVHVRFRFVPKQDTATLQFPIEAQIQDSGYFPQSFRHQMRLIFLTVLYDIETVPFPENLDIPFLQQRRQHILRVF